MLQLKSPLRWAQCNNNSPYKKDTRGGRGRGKGNVKMEVQIRMMWLPVRECQGSL